MNDSTNPGASAYLKSSFIERLVEHVFISEVLQEVWYSRGETVEVLRSEVDASGYDVVLECNSVLRHVQLKCSREGAKAQYQKVRTALESKPCGCVVWIIRKENRDSRRMSLAYRFFGHCAGRPLPSLETFKHAKHTKGNAQGVKAKLPGTRLVPKGKFKKPCDIAELVNLLFGNPTLGDNGRRRRSS